MKKKPGGQVGNKNSVHDKPWTNALERALAQYEKGDIKMGQALRRIADRVVRDAIGGDALARREIAERLDGKPVQPLAGKVDTNITLEIVRFAQNPPTE